jgi:hypothetical protein
MNRAKQHEKNSNMKNNLTQKLSKAAVYSLALLGMLLMNGCGSFELKPWVKPYERAHLADPIMSFTPNPIESSYLSHVYDAREGMRGAEGGAGGGCGCN